MYGPSNARKTTYIEELVGVNNFVHVYHPTEHQFFMTDYDPDVHKIIIFEEFDASLYKMSHLKRLLEGRADSYQVKGSKNIICLLYTSPSPRDRTRSRMPSSA